MQRWLIWQSPWLYCQNMNLISILVTDDVLQEISTTVFIENHLQKKERKRMQRTVKASDRRGYMNEWPIWHRMYWSSDTYFARYYIGTKSYHACANLLAIILQCFSDVYKTFITYKRHRNAIHLYMRRIFDK